jgi:hypothetical protein
MVPEAPLEPTEHGLVPAGDGWFVLNARETRWWDREGRGVAGDFDAEPEFPFPQLGIAVYVLGPGEPMAMYHWEADQEDFSDALPRGLAPGARPRIARSRRQCGCYADYRDDACRPHPRQASPRKQARASDKPRALVGR